MASGELKKHVGAVHVKGRLTLLQRKISNILLLNAYEELPNTDVFEHRIRLKTLAEVAGFDSNDHQLLRESLESLVDVKIKWNLLDPDGAEEWGVSTFLAQAVTKSGVCRYAYAPDLRKKLFNPEIYARINLSVQERFGSAYGLALYENCVRFRKVGTTGWIPLEQWRDLLGVDEGQYEAFKYLNRDVLKTAVDEVNTYSDISVKMETKRERRRVVAIKFIVRENPQLRLELDERMEKALAAKGLPHPRALAPEPNQLLGPLEQRLMAFGLTEAQALDVATEFDPDRIGGNLDYVEAELMRGRAIKNVPAFTLAAIREDYRPRDVSVVQAVEEKKQTQQPRAVHRANVSPEAARQEEMEREREAERTAHLEEVWSELPREEQQRIRAQVERRLQTEMPFIYSLYRTEAEAGKAPEAMSITVRSTMKGYVYEALEAAGRVPADSTP